MESSHLGNLGRVKAIGEEGGEELDLRKRQSVLILYEVLIIYY